MALGPRRKDGCFSVYVSRAIVSDRFDVRDIRMTGTVR